MPIAKRHIMGQKKKHEGKRTCESSWHRHVPFALSLPLAVAAEPVRFGERQELPRARLIKANYLACTHEEHKQNEPDDRMNTHTHAPVLRKKYDEKTRCSRPTKAHDFVVETRNNTTQYRNRTLDNNNDYGKANKHCNEFGTWYFRSRQHQRISELHLGLTATANKTTRQ